MDDETRKKLDKLEREENRQLRSALLLCVFLAFAFGMYWVARNSRKQTGSVVGVTEWAVWRVNEGTGRRYSDIQFKLEDGRLVHGSSVGVDLPKVGSRVLLKEKVAGTGYHSFWWEGEFAPEVKK